MDVFNSQWLINMLAKSSKTPQGRLLSLFDILQDWQNAPNVHIEVEQNASNLALIAFCVVQAKACGAANPEMLAEHIVLIARNATQQAILHPESTSFTHAKKAAHALILAQTQKERLISKPATYAIAASLFLAIGVGAMWLPQLSQLVQPTRVATHRAITHPLISAVAYKEEVGVNAHEAAVMYAKYEQMRNGTCQFPEALQIPDKDKSVYLENVVGGKLPTNLKDLAVANYYLEKVRCNFTPMLMANSR